MENIVRSSSNVASPLSMDRTQFFFISIFAQACFRVGIDEYMRTLRHPHASKAEEERNARFRDAHVSGNLRIFLIHSTLIGMNNVDPICEMVRVHEFDSCWQAYVTTSLIGGRTDSQL